MLASLLKRVGAKLTHGGHWAGPKAQESKKPGEGPPDLDQMWRDFNARLNRLFGPKNNGGGDGGGPGGYRPDMKGAGAMAGIVALVAAFIWLASGVFSVQEGRSAVISTFGKYSHATGPGLNWRLPAPFQSHDIVDVSTVRSAEIGYRGTVANKVPKEALMLTDDLNIIDIQFAVQYTLKDPRAWLFENLENDETVRLVAESAIREVVGKSKMDFVLYVGQAKVALDTQVAMQRILDLYRMGVQVTNVTLQAVQPPEQVQVAFEDAQRAGQDSERAKNEGEAYANQIIPAARGAAARMLEDANAYSTRVTENAKGNAARFGQVVAEYQKAPVVTRDRMYLETMQEIMTSASKVMVDSRAGNNMLYVPLDKMMAQGAANDAARGSKSGPVQATVPMPAEVVAPINQASGRDGRSRETSRDRETR